MPNTNAHFLSRRSFQQLDGIADVEARRVLAFDFHDCVARQNTCLVGRSTGQRRRHSEPPRLRADTDLNPNSTEFLVNILSEPRHFRRRNVRRILIQFLQHATNGRFDQDTPIDFANVVLIDVVKCVDEHTHQLEVVLVIRHGRHRANSQNKQSRQTEKAMQHHAISQGNGRLFHNRNIGRENRHGLPSSLWLSGECLKIPTNVSCRGCRGSLWGCRLVFESLSNAAYFKRSSILFLHGPPLERFQCSFRWLSPRSHGLAVGIRLCRF